MFAFAAGVIADQEGQPGGSNDADSSSAAVKGVLCGGLTTMPDDQDRQIVPFGKCRERARTRRLATSELVLAPEKPLSGRRPAIGHRLPRLPFR